MKAIVCVKYGIDSDSMKIMENMEIPTPKANEILVKVLTSSVQSGDWRVGSFTFPWGFALIARLILGFYAPRKAILGTELSGQIVAMGSHVKRFHLQDDVIVVKSDQFGCHAEYVVVKEQEMIVRKPMSISHDEAAVLAFGGLTSLYFLRQAKLRTGERILINGASGSVGIAAVQIAKYFGAHVTGISSKANHDFIKLYGADEVLDYQTMDGTVIDGKSYDVVMDTVGNMTYSSTKHLMHAKSRLILIANDLLSLLMIPLTNLFISIKIFAGQCENNQQLLDELMGMVELDKYHGVIGKTFDMVDIHQAYQHVSLGHKRGNIALKISS
jgi:NADPH:quinone reductase-like Zn-dependent oxidoreductase